MPDKPDIRSAGDQHERMCFIVMPITDPDEYVKGHFNHVYHDIIQPACQQAGFSPLRADEVKQSNLIHLDILQKLLEAPMAICDLSARNPNVLFELALRQSFDKPVALVQEVGTPQIFDISPLRYTEYRKERIYHEVLEDQKAISESIKETFESHGKGLGINSIVKLLALSRPAAIPEIGSPEAAADLQQLVLAELSQLRAEVRSIRRDAHVTLQRASRRDIVSEIEDIRDIAAHTRILIGSKESNLEEAEKFLTICKNRLRNITHGLPDYSDRDKEMLFDMRRRIELLEFELDERKSSPCEENKP